MFPKLKFNITFFVIFLLIFIAIFGLSCFTFATGYHNMDLGQNINWINAEYDLNLIDYASNYNQYTGTELYINGFNQIKKSFYNVIISVFGISFSLFGIIQNGSSKKHK